MHTMHTRSTPASWAPHSRELKGRQLRQQQQSSWQKLTAPLRQGEGAGSRGRAPAAAAGQACSSEVRGRHEPGSRCADHSRAPSCLSSHSHSPTRPCRPDTPSMPDSHGSHAPSGIMTILASCLMASMLICAVRRGLSGLASVHWGLDGSTVYTAVCMFSGGMGVGLLRRHAAIVKLWVAGLVSLTNTSRKQD